MIAQAHLHGCATEATVVWLFVVLLFWGWLLAVCVVYDVRTLGRKLKP